MEAGTMTETESHRWPGGKSLAYVLRELGLTVAELARRSGVPQSTIYGWIDGDHPAVAVNAEAVCDALGMTYDEVFRRHV